MVKSRVKYKSEGVKVAYNGSQVWRKTYQIIPEAWSPALNYPLNQVRRLW